MTDDDTASRLRAHVEEVAGAIGERNVFRPAGLHAAADYIRSCWRDQGFEVAEQTYELYGVRCANLEVTRQGTVDPERILLVGAHYDTVRDCPGANDNASGIAALLELSRRFTAVSPGTTVRFAAFPNEEPPFFLRRVMGSRVYARAARRRGDDIGLMVSLEMLGYYSDEPGSQRYPPLFRWFYPSRANFIAFVSNLRHRGAMSRMAQRFRQRSSFPSERAAVPAIVPGVSWSDHWSFWREGYPAMMVTDTAFYRYSAYHTPGDTPDRLRYEPFARVTEGLFEAFASWAGDAG